MAKKFDKLEAAEFVDPDALCAFVNPVDRSLSEGFYCRTTISRLNNLWWIGQAEITITFEQIQKFQDACTKQKLFSMLVRFETNGFAGTASVIKTEVEGDIVTVFFVGLTAVQAAC